MDALLQHTCTYQNGLPSIIHAREENPRRSFHLTAYMLFATYMCVYSRAEAIVVPIS